MDSYTQRYSLVYICERKKTPPVIPPKIARGDGPQEMYCLHPALIRVDMSKRIEQRKKTCSSAFCSMSFGNVCEVERSHAMIIN